MTTVSSRDLRNHTAEVLRRVAEGARVTITVHGEPIAEVAPVHRARPRLFNKADVLARILPRQADPGLAAQLEDLAGDTTRDLDAL